MLDLVRATFNPQENPLQKKLKLHPAVEKILYNAHLGIWYWPLDNSQAYFSPALYNLFEINPKRFTPTIEALEALVNGRDAARLRSAFEAVCQRQHDSTTEFTLEHPFDSEKTFHVRLYATPFLDDKTGQMLGILGILQEITQKKRQQNALKQALEVAESANKTKARFLATMSHELRTPLNAIIGFSEMMQAELLGPLGNPTYANYAASIHDSGRHLLDLINDILDMSKIEAGKYELHPECVNVYKALRAAYHMMAGAAQDKQHKFVLPPEGSTTQNIWVDARAFTQILINLLSNAIKYTPAHGIIKIIVQTRHNQEVEIMVQDNGVGIPAEFLPRLGTPFEQFDTQGLARNQQGSGLGLAIVKRLVDMQQGYLHIDSQENVGTCVTIRLPLYKRQAINNTHPYAVKSLVGFD